MFKNATSENKQSYYIIQDRVMDASDHALRGLSFPAQYLEVGEALTNAMGRDVESYFRHCGLAGCENLLPGQTVNGLQIRNSNEWILSLCPSGKPPLITFIDHFPVTIHGVIGMLVITARTLGEALEGALNYFPLVNPAYTVRRHDLSEHVHLIFEPKYDFGATQDFYTETVVAAFLKIAPFLSVLPINLPEVHFTHAPIMGTVEDYHRALGCHFIFGSTQNKLVFSKKYLSIPLLTPSPSSHRFMRASLEQQIRRLSESQSFTKEVRRHLQEAMHRSLSLDAGALADMMAISERTLSRRLGEEGSKLPVLRSEVGCEYAVTLLLETNWNIAKIAEASGFASAAAFTRAFRRNQDTTPTEFRRGMAKNRLAD